MGGGWAHPGAVFGPGVLQLSLEHRDGHRWAGPPQERLKEQNVPQCQPEPTAEFLGTPEPHEQGSDGKEI